MKALGRSLEARKNNESLPEDGYGGEYVIEWAKEMPAGLASGGNYYLGLRVRKNDQQDTLSELGIYFDTWFSEKSMIDNGEIDRVLANLAEKGMAYEKDGATWLSSVEFGDDKDRVLIKAMANIRI